jgi:hypothetical protein
LPREQAKAGVAFDFGLLISRRRRRDASKFSVHSRFVRGRKPCRDCIIPQILSEPRIKSCSDSTRYGDRCAPEKETRRCRGTEPRAGGITNFTLRQKSTVVTGQGQFLSIGKFCQSVAKMQKNRVTAPNV